MYRQWKDFVDFREVQNAEYRDRLNDFIKTPNGMKCEAMAILSTYCSQNNLTKNNERELLDLFKIIIDKFIQKSKYELAIYKTNEQINKELDFLKKQTDNPEWNLCIYSGCHFVNTYIMYPFLVNEYPNNDIKIIESCRHTCVVDFTTKYIYDLAMWNEIIENTNTHTKTIIQDLIDSTSTMTNFDHYDIYDAHKLKANNFSVRWLWRGDKKMFELASNYCTAYV